MDSRHYLGHHDLLVVAMDVSVVFVVLLCSAMLHDDSVSKHLITGRTSIVADCTIKHEIRQG